MHMTHIHYMALHYIALHYITVHYIAHVCMYVLTPPQTNPHSGTLKTSWFCRFVSYGDVTLDGYDEGNRRVTYREWAPLQVRVFHWADATCE